VIIPVEQSAAAVMTSDATPRPEIVLLKDAGHSFTIDENGLPRMAADYPEIVARWIVEQ
jgi:hypothetical protein